MHFGGFGGEPNLLGGGESFGGGGGFRRRICVRIVGTKWKRWGAGWGAGESDESLAVPIVRLGRSRSGREQFRSPRSASTAQRRALSRVRLQLEPRSVSLYFFPACLVSQTKTDGQTD